MTYQGGNWAPRGKEPDGESRAEERLEQVTERLEEAVERLEEAAGRLEERERESE